MTTFALIHGAGDVGWSWHLVEEDLRRRGHATIAPDLPCDDPNATLSDYADTVIAAIGDLPTDAPAGDLVVVGQSFGGFTAPIVAHRLGVPVLLVAAMVPAPGETGGSWFAPADSDDVGDTGEGSEPEEMSEHVLFYHDVPQPLVEELLTRGRDEAASAFGEPWPLGSWPDVPTRVLIGRDDRVLAPERLRRVCQDRLGLVPDEIDGGHCITLANPTGVAEWLHAQATTLKDGSTA